MTHPTGESESDALRFDFDRRLMLQFRGSVVTSDRQPPRLRRSHRVLPQCSGSVAMGAITDTADAHSKRRF